MRAFLKTLLLAILWRYACLRRPKNLLDLPPEVRTRIWHYMSKRVDPRYSHVWDPSCNYQDYLRADGLGRVPVGRSGWPLHPLLQLNHQIQEEALDAVIKSNRLLFKFFDIENGSPRRLLQLHEKHCLKIPHPLYVMFIRHDPHRLPRPRRALLAHVHRARFARIAWFNLSREIGWDIGEKVTENAARRVEKAHQCMAVCVWLMFGWSIVEWYTN